jgi:hypothetical protein
MTRSVGLIPIMALLSAYRWRMDRVQRDVDGRARGLYRVAACGNLEAAP